MSNTPIGGPLRRDLEAALTTDEFRKAFEELKVRYPVFERYPTPGQLVDLAQRGHPDYEAKDQILHVLLQALKEGGNVLFPLLNLMFWDSLMQIYMTRRRRVRDRDELFARIQVDFFHTATDYPLGRRPRMIDSNLVLDTTHRIKLWRRDEGRYRASLEALSSGSKEPAEREPEAPEQGETERYLLEMVYRGVITELQLDLIRETRLAGRMTPRQWAAAKGVPYTTVRTWAARAEDAIRRYEKRRQREEGDSLAG